MLEDEQGKSEVSLGQADQVFPEQRLSSALPLSLTAVQEWHHPLECVFHIALSVGLLIQGL